MTLLELANALHAAERRATTAPWRSNTANNTGDDWLLGSFGCDDEVGDMILTTDRIHASEVDGDGAAADVEFIVLCRNNIRQIIDGLRLASLVNEPELPLPQPPVGEG